MIVQLTGTLVEVTPSRVVLDVHGVGFELGVSANTAAALPGVGSPGVTLLARMVVRDNAMLLYGFATAEERALFDRLCAISGVGPALALSVLSTFTPQGLAGAVGMGDAALIATTPGVGKKLANRLLVELEEVFAKAPELRGVVASPAAASAAAPASTSSVEADVTAALLSMGFSPQEVTLALEGHDEAGATTTEKAVAYALRRLGGGL